VLGEDGEEPAGDGEEAEDAVEGLGEGLVREEGGDG